MQVSTTVELFQLEKMEQCNCQRGFEVIYVCLKKETECADSKKQRYYCARCSQEDKHDHKPIMIVNELDRLHSAWVAFRNEIKYVYSEAQGQFKELEALILYYEDAMMQTHAQIEVPIKWLSIDFKKLKALHEDGMNFYQNKVQPLYSSAQIVDLS